MLVRHQQLVQTLDHIGYITKAARLSPVAKYSNVFSPEDLRHKCRECTAVVETHPRTVSVKYAGYPCVYVMCPIIGHGKGLCKTLCLVIDPPWANRVYVTPVILALRMYLRVAVYLGRRGQQEPCLLFFGKTQGVQRTKCADLQGRYRKFQIINRAGRRG